MYCTMSKTVFIVIACFSIWCIGAITMLHWYKKNDKPRSKTLFWLTSWFGMIFEILMFVKNKTNKLTK